MVKNLPANAGDAGSIPGSGRSPREGNGNPLQYSYLEIPWIEEPDAPDAWVEESAAAWLLQSSLTLCNPIDYSPPGSSVHGILQARVLERVTMSSSRGSSQPRD